METCPELKRNHRLGLTGFIKDLTYYFLIFSSDVKLCQLTTVIPTGQMPQAILHLSIFLWPGFLVEHSRTAIAEVVGR